MRHQHKYFPVKFAKNLRTLFTSEHLRWLLLRSTKFLISSAFLLWSVEAAIRGVFCKKVFLEVSQNSHLSLRPATLFKKRLWHRVFCEISKNTYFTEHLWTTASGSCSFGDNPTFILFKWGLKRKHLPAKCVIRPTEISRMEILFIMRKFFVEKSYAYCGGETILRPFPKKSNWSISLDQ